MFVSSFYTRLYLSFDTRPYHARLVRVNLSFHTRLYRPTLIHVKYFFDTRLYLLLKLVCIDFEY